MMLPFHFDVVVAGGGPAGVTAAIQSARAGARTLLVEKSGILGGTTVLNGVNLPGLFHAWGRQIIAGIGWELVAETVRESGGSMPDFSRYRDVPHHRLQVLVDKAYYAAIVDRRVIESGTTLLLHSMMARVEPNDTGWKVTICSKEGLHSHTCDVLIDCTGDANAVALAGLPLTRNARLQPGTLIMQISGYDIWTLKLDQIEAAYQSEVASGNMLRSDFHVAQNPVGTFLRGRGNNAMQVANIDAATSLSKTNAEIRAREAMLRIIRFLRSQPGLQALKIDYMATECGIRETVTIDGMTRISRDDYISGRVWTDSLCHSFYPIDIHYPDGVGIDIRPLKEGIVPTIPRGAMLPKGGRNLLVAGRSVCGDQEANSAFRVQASSMAMGQAAGAMAALSSASKQAVADLPIKEIHSLLQKHSAIVPEVHSERHTRVVTD